MSRCPGQDGRRLSVVEVECTGCGRMVEMFSDETRRRCPYCKAMVFKKKMPACLQWCQAARACVGNKLYEELVGNEPPPEKK